jgi:outer membrane biosynthesis protein TonB
MNCYISEDDTTDLKKKKKKKIKKKKKKMNEKKKQKRNKKKTKNQVGLLDSEKKSLANALEGLPRIEPPLMAQVKRVATKNGKTNAAAESAASSTLKTAVLTPLAEKPMMTGIVLRGVVIAVSIKTYNSCSNFLNFNAQHFNIPKNLLCL